MRIAIPRGDIRWQRFKICIEDGTPTSVVFTNIYFTVKRTSHDDDYLFQKSLKRGEIYQIGAGDYQLKIEPEDTKNLAIGSYKFDVQVSYKDLLKETFVGDFAVKEEVTHPVNEDEEEEPSGWTHPEFQSESDDSVMVLEVPDYHILTLETPVTGIAASYNDLIDKPQIANTVLQGKLSLEDLGIQPAGTYPSSPLSSAELDELLRED